MEDWYNKIQRQELIHRVELQGWIQVGEVVSSRGLQPPLLSVANYTYCEESKHEHDLP